MSEHEAERVVLHVGTSQDFARRLVEALRPELASAELSSAGEGRWQVRVLPADVARAAEILAGISHPPSEPVVEALPAPAPPWTPPSIGVALVLSIILGLAIEQTLSAVGNPSPGAGLIPLMLLLAERTRRLQKSPHPNRAALNGFACVALAVVGFNVEQPLFHALGLKGTQPAFWWATVPCLLLMLAGLGLCVLGLTRFVTAQGARRTGNHYAIPGAVLVALVLFGMVNGFLEGRAERNGPPGQLAALQLPPGTPFEIPEKNFRFTLPPSPWVRVNAPKNNRLVAFALTRSDPFTFFMIIPEIIPSAPSPEEMVEIWRGQLVSKDPKATLTSRPYVLHGLAGRLAEASLKVNGYDLAYVNLLLSHNGYAYELIAFSQVENREALRREAPALFDHFTLIDPARSAVPEVAASKPVRPFHSSLGYRVELDPAHWSLEADAAQRYPSAEYVARCGKASELLVMPFPLLGHTVSPRVAQGALLLRLGFRREQHPDGLKPLHRDGLEGIALDAPQYRDPHDWTLWAVDDGQTAFLAAASRPTAGPEAGCADPLEQVHFGRSQAVALSDAPRPEKLASFFSGLAEALVSDGKLGAARSLLLDALRLSPADALVAQDLVETDAKRGKLAQALPVLDAALAHAPDTSPVRAVRAALLERLGRHPDALSEYARLFGAGYEEDDTFTDYCHLLEKAGRRGDALAAVARYRQHRDAPGIVALHAGLYFRDGHSEKAVALLEEKLAATGYDPVIGTTLTALHRADQKPAEALRTSDALIEHGQRTAAVYVDKARSEVALGWLPKAKASLEEALRIDPADEDAATLLERVSALLGEGANSSVKTPIAPVLLPAQASAIPPAPSDHADRAEYLLRATAISFVPGKDYRTTDTFQVRVLSEAGVELFSTFEFDFDPLSEALFVNTLKIRDAKGKVISTGKASDSFLSDQAERSGSSQRTLHVPVPGLGVGDTLELVITRRALSPPDAPWFTTQYFAATVPQRKRVLYVEGAVEAFRHLEHGVQPRRVGKGLLFSVERPAVIAPEPFGLPPEERGAMVWLGPSSTTWAQETADYLKTLEEVPVDKPELLATARKWTAGLHTPQERTAALARAVQRELTYQAIEFGRGARIPRPPHTVLEHRYGDCKDHALLLQKLLAAVGVEARLGLVRSAGALIHEVPSLDQFDHMIVVVPGPHPLFLDATSKQSDLLQGPPLGLEGQEVLLLQAGAPAFLTIPGAGSAEHELEISRELQLDRDGGAEIRETLTARGRFAAALRSDLSATAADRRAAGLQGWLRTGTEAVRVIAAHFDALEQPTRPLKVSVHYAIDGLLHRSGARLVGRLPTPWLWGRAMVQADPGRTDPFQVRQPFSLQSHVTVSAPKGFSLAPFHPERSTGKVQTWSVEVGKTEGPASLDLAFERHAGRHPGAEFAAFQRSAATALGAFGQPLVLEPQPSAPSPR